MYKNHHLPRGPTIVGPPQPATDSLPPSSRSDEVLRIVHQVNKEVLPDDTVQLAKLFGRGGEWAQILTSFCKGNDLRVPKITDFIRCHELWDRRSSSYYDITLIGPPLDSPPDTERRVIRYIVRIFGENYTGPVWKISGNALENVPEYVQVFYCPEDFRQSFRPDIHLLNRTLTRRFNRLLHIRGSARGKVQAPPP